MRILNILGVLLVFAAPLVAVAAPGTFEELVLRIVTIIDLVVPILVALAILMFMYSILGSFGIFDKDSKDVISREKFKTAATWGIIIIFVMVSIWGILQILEDTLLTAGYESINGAESFEYCDGLDEESCEV